MSHYALRLPDSLFLEAKKIAEKDASSLNQFFITAIAEKISVMHAVDLLQKRGKRVSKKQYLSVLKKVSKRHITTNDEVL